MVIQLDEENLIAAIAYCRSAHIRDVAVLFPSSRGLRDFWNKFMAHSGIRRIGDVAESKWLDSYPCGRIVFRNCSVISFISPTKRNRLNRVPYLLYDESVDKQKLTEFKAYLHVRDTGSMSFPSSLYDDTSRRLDLSWLGTNHAEDENKELNDFLNSFTINGRSCGVCE